MRQRESSSRPAQEAYGRTKISEHFFASPWLSNRWFVWPFAGHLLDSSQLLLPSPGLQTLIQAFLTTALYVILKLRYRKAVVAPLGWLMPRRSYIAISFFGVVAALAITYLTRWRGHLMPAIPAKDFYIPAILGSILERICVSRVLSPRAEPHVGTHPIGVHDGCSVRSVSYSRRYHTLVVV